MSPQIAETEAQTIVQVFTLAVLIEKEKKKASGESVYKNLLTINVKVLMTQFFAKMFSLEPRASNEDFDED